GSVRAVIDGDGASARNLYAVLRFYPGQVCHLAYRKDYRIALDDMLRAGHELRIEPALIVVYSSYPGNFYASHFAISCNYFLRSDAVMEDNSFLKRVLLLHFICQHLVPCLDYQVMHFT